MDLIKWHIFVLWVAMGHKHFASVSTYLARSRRLQTIRDLRLQDVVVLPAIPKEPKSIVQTRVQSILSNPRVFSSARSR